MSYTGVFACKDLGIAINAGTISSPNYVTVKDVETMKPSLKGTMDTWIPMDQGGWQRALLTGKALDFAFSGKRNIGDVGNDYIFNTLLATGSACASGLQITFPNGDVFQMPMQIELTSPFGGDASKVSTLEWTAHNDGKPSYTPYGSPVMLSISSSVPANNATGIAESVNPVITMNNALTDYSVAIINSTTFAVIPILSATLDSTRKIITVVPTAALTTGTYVMILSGLVDIYGQIIAAQTIKFTCV